MSSWLKETIREVETVLEPEKYWGCQFLKCGRESTVTPWEHVTQSKGAWRSLWSKSVNFGEGGSDCYLSKSTGWLIPFDSIFILNPFFNVSTLHLGVIFVPYLHFVELIFSSLFSILLVRFCYVLLLFLHQRSYFLYLDAWWHFNWMSEHCYSIVGSRFCCITLTNTRCILTNSSVALESFQFFCVFLYHV